MPKILINNYSKILILINKRFISTQSNVKLGDQMKILNVKKEYRKVLQLFDQFNENNIHQCSNWIVIQALTACTKSRDIHYGFKIHNLILSRLKQDSYVLPSLIHFYSKFIEQNNKQYTS